MRKSENFFNNIWIENCFFTDIYAIKIKLIQI